ncbi:MAG: FkbM family methyltransferase [Cyclobacteriaceae bacterium]|nr:MAG: FkbM family methyltransferase [Cyclobacteriaceae bacterium]
MKSSFFKKILVFRSLPSSIRRKILSYYLHRITFTKSTNSEIIWTSFYYFAVIQSVLIKENKSDYLISFNYAGRSLNLLVRKGESSDIYVFFQVFIRDEYAPLFNQIKIQGQTPDTCLDAGANIGYFAVAMLCWFPECRIFCVEPDPDNYTILLKNISLNSLNQDVVPIQAALWVKNTRLFLNKKSVQEWAYTVTEDVTSDGETEALTLGAIFHKYSARGFNAIKIDVEGAEQQLFEDSEFLQCLQIATNIGLEIHDEKANRNSIQETLSGLGYAISNRGELTLAVKTN